MTGTSEAKDQALSKRPIALLTTGAVGIKTRRSRTVQRTPDMTAMAFSRRQRHRIFTATRRLSTIGIHIQRGYVMQLQELRSNKKKGNHVTYFVLHLFFVSVYTLSGSALRLQLLSHQIKTKKAWRWPLLLLPSRLLSPSLTIET